MSYSKWYKEQLIKKVNKEHFANQEKVLVRVKEQKQDSSDDIIDAIKDIIDESSDFLENND